MMPATQNPLPAGDYNTATSLSGGGMAQGDSTTVNPQTQGLLNTEINKAYGDDTNQLMQGVGSAANGLLKDTPAGVSTGGAGDPDLEASLSRMNQSQVGNTVQSIQAATEADNPMRQAQYESDAAGNLAKVSQLDMNDYMLYNQQQLQQLQLQQAQAAAQQSFLGSVLGVAGTALGLGIAAVTGGALPVLAAGVAGGAIGKGTGEAMAPGGPSVPSR